MRFSLKTVVKEGSRCKRPLSMSELRRSELRRHRMNRRLSRRYKSHLNDDLKPPFPRPGIKEKARMKGFSFP